ncbi:transporter [Acinetobacter qingfengensis]|uniref:Transporter n=1 Tax=Acinetobacter qingfengensis TaxID=1262585 RepID=A0A1E7RFS9_9GAMM|nr:transporter [Acinetobacter qingfengensis]KAA8732715.1 transporter [Acinetobacter qingfengensis]OEY98171.1 transporter [Acinetobacter qingfengensis]
MKIKTLSIAIACALPMSGAFAAALDRSGQSISPFLQSGNYFEVGGAVLDPTVEGKDTSGNDTGDMAKSYHQLNTAIKIQPTEHFSFGLIYDQPFGANAEYSGNSNFVSKPTDAVLPSSITSSLPSSVSGVVSQINSNQALSTITGNSQVTGDTKVSVTSHNLSLVLGFQPNENWNFYAGPVYQTIKGTVNLRGSTYSLYNGYDANFKEDGSWGWLAGFAYQIPEIALKASLTYRSEIDHEMTTNENVPLASSLGSLSSTISAISPTLGAGVAQFTAATSEQGKTKITTPQSVNLDLQTGIMENTIAFANIRWVNWKNFSIRPYQFGKVSEVVTQIAAGSSKGFNLVDYSKDQWSVTAGVGRKFSEKWSGTASVGWDSGAGNPVTTLGPTEGYWNVGLGAQYSPAANYFVAGGIKYFWLGDADAQTGAHTAAGEFSDGHAIVYGLKLGYRF